VQDFTEYTNFEEGLAYIEDYMVNNGPFQGIMGFSQVKRCYIVFIIQEMLNHVNKNVKISF